jgi:soluble lytic murein transglycosylase-like protein
MHLPQFVRQVGLCCLAAAIAIGCAETAGASGWLPERATPVTGIEPGAGSEAHQLATLKPLVSDHAAKAGVPVALAHAVVRVESQYDPRASYAGNYGLMQIRLLTARDLGYGGGIEGLFHPDTNLTFGMRSLAGALKIAGGDICRTVMKYQSGHYARIFSRANARYCAKVKAYMREASGAPLRASVD